MKLTKCAVVDTDKDGWLDDEKCVDPATAYMGEDFKWLIVVENDGPNELGDCVVADDAGAGWSFDTLAVGKTVWSVEPDVCDAESLSNHATVTCTLCAGESNTSSDDDTATILCEKKKACYTRSPGYWGTHPDATASLLTVRSCGLDIVTVAPDAQGSATQDLCESGLDAKGGGVSPQQLQLVRQCTAAALNLAATSRIDGDCGGEITALMAECCDDGSLCTSGASGQTISESGCIERLDMFNNSEESEDGYEGEGDKGDDACTCAPRILEPDGDASFAPGGPADPTLCQEARGDGVINTRPPAAGVSETPAKMRSLQRTFAPELAPKVPQIGKPSLLER